MFETIERQLHEIAQIRNLSDDDINQKISEIQTDKNVGTVTKRIQKKNPLDINYFETANKIYFDQRNNEYLPHRNCFATSVTNMLSNEGFDFSAFNGRYDQFSQPEDKLAWYLDTPEAYTVMYELEPWTKDKKIAPRNISSVAFVLVNRFVGYKLLNREYLSPNDAIEILKNRHTFVMGAKLTRSGHFINIIGLEYEGKKPMRWIADDSYGNWHPKKGYVHGRSSGNNVRYGFKIINDLSFALSKNRHPVITINQ